MRKVILLTALLFGVSIVFAKPVSKDFAIKIAYNYYKHYESSKSSNFFISNSFEIKFNGKTTMYVFNFSPGGYVIIAADDASIPALGASGTSEIKENSDNENLNFWLSCYSREISFITNNNLSNKQTIKEWNDIAVEIFPLLTEDVKEVTTPLITTNWDQTNYYNDSCPGGSLVGCVAVAMCQVMKYHNYPTVGVGSHQYTDPTYGLLKANFGATTYSWGSMPNSVSSPNSAVAQLLFHGGVSVDMVYSTSVSNSYNYRVPNALINHFDYQNTAEIKYKSDFTDFQWKEMIKNELNYNRPVYYSGNNSGSTNGHAFNCDGWRISDGKFHFNWGWSGSSDGWFTIGALNPGYDFNYFNSIVIRVRPKGNVPKSNFNVSNFFPAASAPVNFTDISLNTPTGFTWKFEGGTPSASNTQNPMGVTFATNGKKLVTLMVSNANGTDVSYKLVNVGSTPGAWIKQNTGFSTVGRGIESIEIVNPQIVWAVAYDGSGDGAKIFDYAKTVDGGNTWTPLAVPSTFLPTGALGNIWPFDANTAWACLNPGASTGGKILKTTDGGTNWIEQTTALFTGSSANWVAFFNQNEGICMGDPVSNVFCIYTTTDGGTNWTKVPGINIPNAVANELGTVGYFDIAGPNTIYFGSTAGKVYKSTDKGLNWSVCGTTGFAASWTDVSFKDETTGIAINYYSAGPPVVPYKLAKTTNGGANWATLTPIGPFIKNYLDYVPGTPSRWINVGASTNGGQRWGSSYSEDDCTTFINIDTGTTQYTAVKFLDAYTGWAGGFNASVTGGGIWKCDPDFFYYKEIKEIAEKNEVLLRVYPNPSQGIYNIAFLGSPYAKPLIEVYDMVGRLVLSTKVDLSLGNIYPIDISNQNSGLYFIKVTTENQTLTEKVSLIK
ncbi:MAG: C10 family peptidase [Bacteroidales bacterium]|nr:C10 family peptidase [Bacteroidales bacterium]